MTAPALRIVPSMDDVRDRVDDVRDLVASVPHMTMPRLQDVGRQADETVDRLLGRPARPFWFKPVLVIGVVGVMAAIAAMAVSWTRGRPGRLMDEDAIDQMDQLSDPLVPALDQTAGDPISGLAPFGSSTVVETGITSLNDQQADVH